MRTSAAARFKTYLAERRIAETEAALGAHYTSLWRLANGKRNPGLALAFAIEALTRRWPGGQIRAQEWIEPARRKAARPTSARRTRRAAGGAR